MSMIHYLASGHMSSGFWWQADADLLPKACGFSSNWLAWTCHVLDNRDLVLVSWTSALKPVLESASLSPFWEIGDARGYALPFFWECDVILYQILMGARNLKYTFPIYIRVGVQQILWETCHGCTVSCCSKNYSYDRSLVWPPSEHF